MSLRRFTSVVLTFFLAGLWSVTAGELGRLALGDDHGCHADGGSCPDEPDHGHACGPACPCACCPGHAPVVSSGISPLSPWLPPTVELTAPSLGAVHSNDVPLGIYRPPRG